MSQEKRGLNCSDFGFDSLVKEANVLETLSPKVPREITSGNEIYMLDESMKETAAIESALPEVMSQEYMTLLFSNKTLDDDLNREVQAFETTFLRDPLASEVIKGANEIHVQKAAIRKRKFEMMVAIAALGFLIMTSFEK